MLLRIFAEDLLADFISSLAAVFELEDAGVFEFVDVLQNEIGDVEFEAGAFAVMRGRIIAIRI